MKYAFTIFPPQIGVPPSFPAKFVHIYVYILYPPPSPPHKCSTKSALTATPPIPSNSTISIYVYTLFLSLFAKAPKPILRDVRYFSVRLIIVSAILRSRQRAASKRRGVGTTSQYKPPTLSRRSNRRKCKCVRVFYNLAHRLAGRLRAQHDRDNECARGKQKCRPIFRYSPISHSRNHSYAHYCSFSCIVARGSFSPPSALASGRRRPDAAAAAAVVMRARRVKDRERERERDKKAARSHKHTRREGGERAALSSSLTAPKRRSRRRRRRRRAGSRCEVISQKYIRCYACRPVPVLYAGSRRHTHTHARIGVAERAAALAQGTRQLGAAATLTIAGGRG